MTPSKRFVIASFFAAITISVLCNSIFSILDKGGGSSFSLLDLYLLLYSISFLMFLIKYFVDDVVDDRHDENERITRNSLATLVIGWTLFLLSALFAKNIFTSSVLWLAGLLAITRFLYRNKKLVEHHATLYLRQNFILMVVLCFLAVSTYSHSLSALSAPASNVCRSYSLFRVLPIICLSIFNVWFFIVLLRDNE
jgi:hypothetical protein